MHNEAPSRVKATITDSHFLIALGVGLTLLINACFAATTQAPAKNPQNSKISVPLVGCASDGQQGPVKAPRNARKSLAIPVAAARQLAYYKAEYGPGVLGPLGWYCFSTYGSNGSSLYINPQPIDGKDLFSDKWKGFTGPAIQLSVMEGGTSGRFDVARVIARVFPTRMGFLKDVIAEGIEPASDFPTGPYASDKLIYRSKEMVEYRTPANASGLGTDSRLAKNNEPIYGVAILSGEDTNLTQAAIRVSAPDAHLVPVILREVEREAASSGD